MTDSERAIKIIKSECYIFDLLDLDRTVMVNTALDMAIDALEQKACMEVVQGDCIMLTREAYSDLCSRAADVPDFESEEYVNERLNNYNKLLKSGILDCIIEKSQESEDKE